MTAVIENIPTLTPPEPGWGAVKRKLRVSDFTTAAKVLAVAAILWGLGHTPEVYALEHNGQSISGLLWSFSGIATLVFLIVVWFKSGDRRFELEDDREALRIEWEENVLTPYIESKYNVRVLSIWGPLNNNAGAHVRLLDERNRQAEVEIRGLSAYWNFMRSGDVDYYIHDEVTIEEVIRPKPEPKPKTRYIPLSPKSDSNVVSANIGTYEQLPLF